MFIQNLISSFNNERDSKVISDWLAEADTSRYCLYSVTLDEFFARKVSKIGDDTLREILRQTIHFLE